MGLGWSLRFLLLDRLIVLYAVGHLEGENFDGEDIGQQLDRQKSDMKFGSQCETYADVYPQAVSSVITEDKDTQAG